MSGKKTSSGLGARMAAVQPVSSVAAGFAAATEAEPDAKPPPPVAINIRLPKDLHTTLRQIAFDHDTSINALLVRAARQWLAGSRT